MDRRTFLKSAAGLAATGLHPSAHKTRAGGPGLLPLHGYAQQQQLRGKVKITDVKCMIVRGTWDWNLIKIETDSGLYGIGEAYWGWGVKDLVINKLRPIVLGEDPLNVDKLYTKMLMESAGAGAIAGVTVTAASGIEIALWDLAGRILADACVQSARRTVPRSRPLLSHDAGGRAAGGSAGLARTGPARPRRRSSAGRRSSSRATASRRRPIPTTRSRATIAIPAGSR